MKPRLLAVLATLMLAALPAAAQDLAGKTVTIVVPFTPGAVSDPLARVIAPRFWGGVISMPLLAALFSTLGVFGAYLVGVKLIDIDPGAFWGNMKAAVDFRFDILNGIIKSFVFGVAVSLIAVFEGFDAKPTAEGVSTATTRTVVKSSLAILALDFVLTVFMFRGLGA